MRQAMFQELLVLTTILAVAVLVFVETGAGTGGGAGQVSSGTFPRLVAGAMGLFAVARMLLFLAKTTPLDGDYDWHLSATHRALAATVLMILYILLFRQIHFALLTFVFLLLVFLAFGVRPFARILIVAVLSTGFLYVLFVHIVGIVR